MTYAILDPRQTPEKPRRPRTGAGLLYGRKAQFANCAPAYGWTVPDAALALADCDLTGRSSPRKTLERHRCACATLDALESMALIAVGDSDWLAGVVPPGH